MLLPLANDNSFSDTSAANESREGGLRLVVDCFLFNCLNMYPFTMGSEKSKIEIGED